MLECVEVRRHIRLGPCPQQPLRAAGCDRLLLKAFDEKNPVGHMIPTPTKALLASASAAEHRVSDEQMSTCQEWLTDPCLQCLTQILDPVLVRSKPSAC